MSSAKRRTNRASGRARKRQRTANSEDINTVKINMDVVHRTVAMANTCSYASKALRSLREYATGSPFTLSLFGVITEDVRLKNASEYLETQIDRATQWSLLVGFIPFRRVPPPDGDRTQPGADSEDSGEEEKEEPEDYGGILMVGDEARDDVKRQMFGDAGRRTQSSGTGSDDRLDSGADEPPDAYGSEARGPSFAAPDRPQEDKGNAEERETLQKFKDAVTDLFTTRDLLFEVPSVGLGEYSTYVDPDTMVRKVRCDRMMMGDTTVGRPHGGRTTDVEDQLDPDNEYRWRVYVVEEPTDSGIPSSPAVRVVGDYENYVWISEMERQAVRLGVDPIVVSQRENLAGARRAQDQHANSASDLEMLQNHAEQIENTGVNANLVEELRTVRENFNNVSQQLYDVYHHSGPRAGSGAEDALSSADAREHYIRRGYQYSNQIRPTHIVGSRDALEQYRAALSVSFGIPSRDLGSVSNRFKEDRDSQIPPLMEKARQQRQAIADFVQVVMANIVPRQPINRLLELFVEQFTEMRRVAWVHSIIESVRRAGGGSAADSQVSSPQRTVESLRKSIAYMKDASVRTRPFKLTWDMPLYVSRENLDDIFEQLSVEPEDKRRIIRNFYGLA